MPFVLIPSTACYFKVEIQILSKHLKPLVELGSYEHINNIQHCGSLCNDPKPTKTFPTLQHPANAVMETNSQNIVGEKDTADSRSNGALGPRWGGGGRRAQAVQGLLGALEALALSSGH